MLDVLRRGASTWVSKLLLSLLIVSFGIWGIADVFRGFGSNTAYKIGSHEIGVAELDWAYNRELRQQSQRAGRPINKDEALRSGMSQYILSRITTDATFQEIARDLRLAVSDEAVGKEIVADPAFKGGNGAFDKNRFAELLRSNGLNEGWYVGQRRNEMLRAQVIDAVSAGMTPSRTWLELLDRFRNEERKIEWVSLSPASLGSVAAPADADLATFYEGRKVAFRAPETRSVVALRLDASVVAKPGDVTDDDAKAEYDRQKTRWSTPEKRRVLQIAFDDRAEAEAAVAEIKAGKSFEAIAEARGIKVADLDLGLMTKSAFLDAKVADAAFALSAVGATSDAVIGRLRPVVLKLVEVAAGSETPFAQVAGEIKADIAKKRAEGDVLTLHDQIEDALAGGAKLADVAKRFSLPLTSVDRLTKAGTVADGSKPDLPQFDKFLAGVFESDVGVENDPIDLGGHGFMWYALTAIDPAHDRPLDEVKDKVLAAWTSEQVSQKLAATAKEVEKRLAEGKPFAEAVAPTGAEIRTTEAFRRSDVPEGLSPSAVAVAFAGPNGHVASAHGVTGEERLVVHVVEVIDPIYFPGTDLEKQVAQSVSVSLRNGVLEGFVRAEQAALGVKANPTVIARVTGRSKD